MVQIFERYPELMLYDGSYKMNNMDMPLFTQLCVDGNGESEICSIYITRSESYLSIGTMVDIFQSLNPAWKETKIILGDKDFADRVIYAEKYPGAVLQICLWHTLVAMNREVTTSKRDITAVQRKHVLEILQRIVYAESNESYQSIYKELLDSKLEQVIKYYNDNWHGIRDEWTQFGRNVHANYLNGTNNRTESINQKFKIVGNRHANLLSFFENIFTTVTVLASERDIRAVKMTMRVPRKRFTDEYMTKYNNLLTPFIFEKLQFQHELSELIEFAVIEDDTAITAKQNKNGHTVTAQHCSCMYFSAMQIPCRHLFKFWLMKEMDLFQPDLCAIRWTKSYYYDSHPAINSFEQVTPRPPTHVVRLRVPTEIDKFKKSATVTKDINNFMSNMSNSQFEYFLEKVRNVRSEMVNKPVSTHDRAGSSNVDEVVASTVNHEAISSHSSMSSSFASMPNRQQYHSQLQGSSQDAPTEHTHQRDQTISKTTFNRNQVISQPQMQISASSSIGNRVENQHMSQPVLPNTSTAFQRITLPPKITSVGRPKGAGNTVIGVRKRKTTNLSTYKDPTPPKKTKFVERNLKEQGVLISTWLTNWPENRIGQRKISLGDIIQDPHIFNRLRHKQLNLECIKNYLDKKTFKYIEDEVERLKTRPYACRKCQRNLSGIQIMCHGCLDWYHDKCITLPPGETKNIIYFCEDC